MATLVLTSPGSDVASRWSPLQSLADWLAADWALVFSHPRDFAHEGFESDRWLRIVRDAFRERGLRAVGLAAAHHEVDPGWIGEVSADDTVLALPAAWQSVQAGMLREQLESLDGHFVLVVDAQFHVHGVLRYVHSYMNTLSPLDLLEAVDDLRGRAMPSGLRPAPRRDHIPC
jgi:alkyl hydroperoxide reductase subunit AhpC